MKTSNKLLVGVVGFILLSMFGLVLMGRMSMTTVKSEQMVGNGNTSEEYRTVAPFNGLKIASGIQATLSKGDQQVGLRGDENLLEFLETVVEGDVLIIRWKSGFSVHEKNRVTAMITMPKMNYLSVSSGAKLETEDNFVGEKVHVKASSGSVLRMQGLTAESLDLDLSSSSNVRFSQGVSAPEEVLISLSSGSELDLATLTTEQVKAEMNSSSKMKINGGASSLIVSSSSGARFEGAGFAVQNANLKGSSSASFEVMVSDKLHVNLSSGSEVRYAGEPQLTQNLSSGSSVRRMN